MKAATVIFAACAVLISMLMPVTTLPFPEIQVQGRNLISRFAPPARPVFPRTYFDNSTKTVPEVEKRNFHPIPPFPPFPPFPTATHHKRNYPAGPTASGYVFRSEHYN